MTEIKGSGNFNLKLRYDRPAYLIASKDVPEGFCVHILNRDGRGLVYRVPAGVEVLKDSEDTRNYIFFEHGLNAGAVIELSPRIGTTSVGINGGVYFEILRQKHVDSQGGLARVVKNIMSRQSQKFEEGAA